MDHKSEEWTFVLRDDDPNNAYVQWPYGGASVGGSRHGREKRARLISAAPQLLAALEATRHLWQSTEHANACNVAIAKATQQTD
jgi:hypothetical protein